MRPNKVKKLWRAGQSVVAGWCSTADPFVAEVMTRGGFDALILDMQHGMGIGPERAAAWLQVVGQNAEVTPIVRVPWNEPAYVQWVLDAGAMGVIIPMVNNLEDARKAIGACRYPPVGYRSNGPNRAGYLNGREYFDRANDEVICLLMMETIEAIENIEDIAKLPKVDGFYIGPTDLAASMGLEPVFDVKDSRHVAAVQKVIDVAKRHGQDAGIHVGSVEEGIRRTQQGFKLVPICTDIRLLDAGIERSLSEFRQGLASPATEQ